MDLRGELARQGLLLEFIAECVGLDSVEDIARLVKTRLHWICDHDTCAILMPDSPDTVFAVHERRSNAGDAADTAPSLAVHRAVLEEATLRGASSLTRDETDGAFVISLPLGTGPTALGALCLRRARTNFSHGDMRHLQHACSAVGGALTRIAAVTAEREAARAVKQAEAQLRSVAEDRALFAEQMVGIVSHDLRNPLAAIMMGTVLMERGEALTPRKEQVLSNIKRANRRAQRLVEDLLDFTQTRVGPGLALKKRRVDLDELVDLSVDELQLSFPGLDLRRRACLLGAACVDADRFQQMLGNLVANAVTYGAASSPIELDCRVEDGVLCVTVRNQGNPIPEPLLETMFEPMSRGKDASGGNRNVGLGLYIVRAIVHAHGGSIDVTSSRADGTCFIVRIPLEPADTAAPPYAVDR